MLRKLLTLTLALALAVAAALTGAGGAFAVAAAEVEAVAADDAAPAGLGPLADARAVSAGIHATDSPVEAVLGGEAGAVAELAITGEGLTGIGTLNFRVSYDPALVASLTPRLPEALAGIADIWRVDVPQASPESVKVESFYVYVKPELDDAPLIDVADGAPVLYLDAALTAAASAAEAGVAFLLAHFDAVYYDPAVGGGIVGVDAVESIDPAKAVVEVFTRGKYDVNGDGAVTLADVNAVRQYLGKDAASSAAAKAADIDGDGAVTLADLTLIIAAYEATVNGESIEPDPGPSAPAQVQGYYQVSNVGGIPGSRFYLYASSGRDSDMTPIFYVFGDEPYGDLDAAKAAMEASGLVGIADAERGVVILVDPVGAEWGKADVDVYEAIMKYIFGGTGGKVSITTFYNLQFAIGEGAGATFVNNYLSYDSKRLAGVLTFGGDIAQPVPRRALPAYLVSASEEAVAFYLACNDNTEVIPSSGRVADVLALRKSYWETEEAADRTIYTYAPSPVRQVVVSKAGATSLDKGVIADAWSTMFRWIQRSDVYTSAARFTGDFYNESEFILQPRPDFEGAGFLIESFNGAEYATGLRTVVAYVPKAAQDAMASGSGQRFPLLVVFPPSGERLEVDGQGWGQLAIDHDLNIVTARAREPALGAALLDAVASRYPVDATRVYAAGFSGGSHDVMYVSEGIPERFAAVAIMDVFDGPHYPNLLAAAPGYAYDIDLPIAVVANGMSTESTNYDGHFAWYDAVQQIYAINEVPQYEGELDFASYPFWGFPLAVNKKVEPPAGLAIWRGYSYDAAGVPIFCAIHTDVTEHARYSEYANVIWDFFAPLSRDAETHAVVYAP
jgi:hypothetical protein